MLKAWSITTTVRNPDRLREFLIALRPLEGKEWNRENQQKFQKLLIKNRLYGYGSQQFYNGLPQKIIGLVNDVDHEIDNATVDEIVEIKKYRDFDMRGRQSLNPLTKFGFVYISDSLVKITPLGHRLIASEKDTGEVFLRSFLKWQIPNPASDDYENDGHYNVVPFVATLKLISAVNDLEVARGGKAVGISKREFSLFVPTLVNYADIAKYAHEVLVFRDLQKNKTKQERKEVRDTYRKNFAINFLGTTDPAKIDKLLTNLHDYGDNAIRYFRLTKYIRVRGGGFYVDIEPSRHTEIETLFESEFYKPRDFADREEYLIYMADDSLPHLPWQTKEKLTAIASEVHREIESLQVKLKLAKRQIKDIAPMTESDLANYIEDMRAERTELQERDNHVQSQPVESVVGYINQLENIFEYENRALMLEYLSTMGLHAFNDAQEIKPNYPVGDDNMPTSTAPGGMGDIECHYDSFNMICEVTMLKGRDQWFNEGQPVMRHLRNFEKNNTNSYCIFIAPSIHPDSAETFWIANKIGYKGSRQRIAPLTISQFVEMLKVLKSMREENKPFTNDMLQDLVKSISDSAEVIHDSDEWIAKTGNIVTAWAESLVN